MTSTTAPARRSPRPAAPRVERALPTVLLVHNKYKLPGGEDGVFEREGEMLEAMGHRVLRYVLHNDGVDGLNPLQLATRTLWSQPAYREVRALVEREGVDVVHVHNTLPLASPAVFHAAHAAGAATLHTLHNYRLVCPGGLLLRDGTICHDCVGKAFAAPAIRHKCYRDSAGATAGVTASVALHRALGTWDREVDRFIALSAFARDVFIEGGLPGERIAVKPNIPSEDPGPGPGGGTVLYAGRLTEEKGLRLLLDAWAEDPTLPPLRIAGDGPLGPLVQAAADADPRIGALGWLTGDRLSSEMSTAALLIVPSTWYEGWPLSAIEAMGHGTPVVATDHGPFPDMIEDGVTGRLFPRGDRGAMVEAIRDVLGTPAERAALRASTRARFEARYAQDVSYAALLRIYEDAIAQFTTA